MSAASPRPPRTHALLCAPGFLGDIRSGVKTFEVRRNDRGYRVGDVLTLCEQGGCRPTRAVRVPVTYILANADFPDGLKPGYCVLGLGSPSSPGDISAAEITRVSLIELLKLYMDDGQEPPEPGDGVCGTVYNAAALLRKAEKSVLALLTGEKRDA